MNQFKWTRAMSAITVGSPKKSARKLKAGILSFHSYISHKVVLFLRDSLLLRKNYYFRNDGLFRQKGEVNNEAKKTYKKV